MSLHYPFLSKKDMKQMDALKESYGGATQIMNTIEEMRAFDKRKEVAAEMGFGEMLEKAKIYSDFIVANMGHHGPTSDLSAELFSGDDWEYMAGITDEEMEREAALFDRVEAAKPANLKIADT